MEDRLTLFQNFLDELNRYCEASVQTDKWYEAMSRQLSHEQESKRLLNEDNYRKQQSSFRSIQDRNAREQEALQKKIREKILKKQEMLGQSIKANEEILAQILSYRDQIIRPEYFQYAYRYREYGDFFPEVTRLEDFRELELKSMVKAINDPGSGIWVNRLRGLFRSEDMMTEYARFANLLGKARYLCEVENDALRTKAQIEIRQMEKEMNEAEDAFRDQAAELMKKQQKVQADNGTFGQMFSSACDSELKELNEEYRDRQYKIYEELMDTLRDGYSPQTMKEAYSILEEAAGQHMLCEDGVPLSAKLGPLWFTGAELMKNDKVRQVLQGEYPFMISEGSFSIPGIA